MEKNRVGLAYNLSHLNYLHLRPLPSSTSSAPQLLSPTLSAIAALVMTEVSPMVAVLILSADNESYRLHVLHA